MTKPISTLHDAHDFVSNITKSFELYTADHFWQINAHGFLWKSVGCEDGRLVYALKTASMFYTAMWVYLHRRAVNFVLHSHQLE